MKISFLGLGIMGSRMAANLLKGGVELTVWNRSPEAVSALVEAGAIGADNPTDAVVGADLVISMLSTPAAVTAVMLGKGGAVNAMQAGALWMDCSTVNPSFSRECAEVVEAQNIGFLDAPVAGTKPQAAAAQLAFFVGAKETEIEEVRPYLDMMGAKVISLGETGMGASFKMLVNIMLAQSMVIFSESVLLGQQLGLDRAFLLNVLPGLVVSAPFTKFKAEMIREDDYEVQFPLEWMHKDLHLATLTAYESNQPLYLANLTKEIFASAKAAGMGRLDFAAIHRFLEAGSTIE